MEVLKTALSFVVPEEILDPIFNILGTGGASNDDIMDELRKLDIILDADLKSSVDYFKMAMDCLRYDDFTNARHDFIEAEKNAISGFNKSLNIKSWFESTQMKLASSFMKHCIVP